MIKHSYDQVDGFTTTYTRPPLEIVLKQDRPNLIGDTCVSSNWEGDLCYERYLHKSPIPDRSTLGPLDELTQRHR